MSWRKVQLDNRQCEQDQFILELFNQAPVRYVGKDLEFAKQLTIDEQSQNLILIVNKKFWASELVSTIKDNFSLPTNCFYIGINRYGFLGNDTDFFTESNNSRGDDIIKLTGSLLKKFGYVVERHGSFDNDRGRYFNFVQPLTWLYGKATNTSN